MDRKKSAFSETSRCPLECHFVTRMHAVNALNTQGTQSESLIPLWAPGEIAFRSQVQLQLNAITRRESSVEMRRSPSIRPLFILKKS